MSAYAAHLARAFEELNDDLEQLIDRITYNTPELACWHTPAYLDQGREVRSLRPFKVTDAANGDVIVAEFESWDGAWRFAHGHQRVYGSTIDFDSFRAVEP